MQHQVLVLPWLRHSKCVGQAAAPLAVQCASGQQWGNLKERERERERGREESSLVLLEKRL
jgi:hypothetical protein